MDMRKKINISTGSSEALQIFYAEVCSRAEQKMLITGKLEGAHFAAMTELMKELGLLEFEGKQEG